MPYVFPSENRRPHPPDLRIPTDEELLVVAGARPLLSLRELCRELWPDLSWASAVPGGDSAAETLRTFGCALGPERMTAAAWVRQRMLALVARGAVRLGVFQRGEPLEAGITYYLPGPAVAPVEAASRRRVVLLTEGVPHA